MNSMAIDGFKIIDSDLAHDIRNAVLDLYDRLKSEQEIKSYLKSELLKCNEPLDVEIFVSASCLVLWEIGMSDGHFLRQLETITHNGADRFWLENFDTKNYEKRNVELGKLLIKIQEPSKKIRRRKIYKELANTLFVKGDVLAINFEGKYRCIIFENFYQNRNDAYYSFVVTTYNSNVAPIPENILLEEIPVIKKTKAGEIGIRTLAIYYKDVEKHKLNFTRVGTMHLDPKAESLGFLSQVNGFENLSDMIKRIDNILLGEKAELHFCYSF
jgi:hypothetical protein